MRPTKMFIVLPVLLATVLNTQCNRSSRYPSDYPASDKNQPGQSGSATTPVPSTGALPPGISANGGQGNSPTSNPDNPQTNPRTNLDGTQSPTPDPRAPRPSNDTRAPHAANKDGQ